MQNAMTVFIAIIGILCIGFLALVVLSNRAASREFGPDFCWLKQGRDVVNLRELEFATTGYFVPNPLTLINRRFLGIGMEDPGVKSPHFAVLAPNDAGDYVVWGWSFRTLSFWRDDNGTIDKFVSDDLRETCKSKLP